MRTLIYRTIPLSEETRQAYKSIDGVYFARRDRTPDEVMTIGRRQGYDVVLNLGSSDGFEIHNASPLLWNSNETVQALLTPASTRRSAIGHLLPPRARTNFPAWIKFYGRGGRNKHFVPEYSGNTFQLLVEDTTMDVQEHIDGEEYRVVTVGPVVVQCSRRSGTNAEREYTWVGVENCPGPVASIARYASTLLPSPRTVIGWDVIKTEDRVFILEGNTCPGLNQATARRVFSMIEQYVNNYVDFDERQQVALRRAVRNAYYPVYEVALRRAMRNNEPVDELDI